MEKTKVTYMDVDSLIPYANNPRLNDNAVDAVAASIKEFGFKVPMHSDCKDLDRLFEDCIEFLDSSGALSVALAQGGDLIGGANNFFRKGLSRKAMNTFFCKTSRRFWFVGRVNEDVNTYTSLGNKGGLFLTITNTQICQQGTQSQAGGMSEMYLDSGTYVKSFYSVIFSPQAVRVAEMGAHHRRMHHRVNWNACTPKILSDRYRKRR